MRNLTSLPLAPLALLGLVHCGGETPPPSAPSAPVTVTGTVTGQTPAQHTLAHFRSPDGMVGLVLDRTGTKPKYQVDGKAEIVELTQKERRETWGGHLEGYFFTDPSGTRVFFIDEGGSITFHPDGDHLGMMFDKDVPPLAAATVTGTYVPPPPAYKATVDRLTPLAVRTRFPEVKPEDSANLAKVADVVGRATADMFVHYVSRGQTDWLPHVQVVPASFGAFGFGGVGRTSDEAWDAKAKGLAHYGGKNQGFSHYDTPQGNHMQVLTLQGYAPQLAERTPGLVWELDGTTATFVTLDGDRYQVDLSKSDTGQTLDAGAGQPATWPAAAADALLTVPDVYSLAKAGAIPQKSSDDLIALDTKWTQCAAKVWSGAQRQVDTGHFNEADRKDYEKKARTTCASIIQLQESMLVKAVEARLKERLDLFGKAKARVTQLGEHP